jgi:nucleotide-binding universal stress UspA family protein
MTNQQYLNVAFKNIAFTIDFSECSERAVQHGVAVARHFGATLHFLYLVRPSEYVYTPEMIPALDEVAVRDCDQLIAKLKSNHRLDGVEFQRWVEEGEISEIVGDFVQKHHIDLLVVGTHGRTGIPKLLLGLVAQEIFHYVRCPSAPLLRVRVRGSS